MAAFRENIERISSLQKRGETVTLPLKDLREALVRQATNSIVRTAEGWEVQGDTLVASHTPYGIPGKDVARDHHGVYTAAVSGTAVLVAP